MTFGAEMLEQRLANKSLSAINPSHLSHTHVPSVRLIITAIDENDQFFLVFQRVHAIQLLFNKMRLTENEIPETVVVGYYM